MAVPDDLRELLEAGSHFGHQVRRWNPKMSPFIYTARDGVHVFDLTITAKLLNEACDYIRDLAKQGKNIVFVGTKRQAKAIVKEEAVAVGAPFVIERWLGGTITNWEEIHGRIKTMINMKASWENGGYDKYTKKERVLINKDIARLERFLGGISNLKSFPDALFVIDTIKEKVAVKEAAVRQVPVIAIVDSNSDPEDISHPIPANDDAVRSLKYIVHRVAEAYGQGRAEFEKRQQAASQQSKEAFLKQAEAAKTGK